MRWIVRDKKPLWEDILTFSKDKYKIASLLIIIGTLGLVFPIIPGLLLIGFGLLLLKPEWYEKIRKKLTGWID
jgi:hypothetical protein